MKAPKSHPQIEQPRSMNNRINLARYTAGLVLALVGLSSAALMKGSIQLASADTVALHWRYTGSLNTLREGHSATLLPDGKVLVVGGAGRGFQGFDSAEVYDPAMRMWSVTGRLNVPRSGHTATLLKDGKVLIVGGDDFGVECYPYLKSAEMYDSQDGKWGITGSLNTPRCFHTATLLKDGKVLVVGGLEEANPWDCGYKPLDTAELYDPDTGIWSFTGILSTAIAYHTATLLQNGKVLVLGDSSAELYDPDTGTWSSAGSLGGNVASFGHTATLLRDGRVLIVGGVTSGEPIRQEQLYDPDTEAWSSTGLLKGARVSHTATLLPDGKVLVAGGIRHDLLDPFLSPGSQFVRVSVSRSELYDPDKGTWSFAGSLKTQLFNHTATLLLDGTTLIVGGSDGSGALASVQLGNPVMSPKITMASVVGKKLIVVGENFDPDAVILINGMEQKTRNDDQNPETTLIGKKAGKKIKPGDRLQIRNPDDTLSEEFIFTGS